jgi:hypothetical protein
MTHSPEPLSPESLHALSWEAATERLVAAACIPVEEAEAFKAAHAAREASIEVGMCSHTVRLHLPSCANKCPIFSDLSASAC